MTGKRSNHKYCLFGMGLVLSFILISLVLSFPRTLWVLSPLIQTSYFHTPLEWELKLRDLRASRVKNELLLIGTSRMSFGLNPSCCEGQKWSNKIRHLGLTSATYSDIQQILQYLNSTEGEPNAIILEINPVALSDRFIAEASHTSHAAKMNILSQSKAQNFVLKKLLNFPIFAHRHFLKKAVSGFPRLLVNNEVNPAHKMYMDLYLQTLDKHNIGFYKVSLFQTKSPVSELVSNCVALREWAMEGFNLDRAGARLQNAVKVALATADEVFLWLPPSSLVARSRVALFD